MSYRFGKTSTARLCSCHPDLQTIFNEVIKVMDCTIVCGHRNEADQQAAYNAKPQLSKVQYPNSNHNTYPSLAVDVAPYDATIRNIDWGDTNRFYYFAGRVMEVARRLREEGKILHDLRWGGDWDRDTEVDDQTFIDLPHYELVGEFILPRD